MSEPAFGTSPPRDDAAGGSLLSGLAAEYLNALAEGQPASAESTPDMTLNLRLRVLLRRR